MKSYKLQVLQHAQSKRYFGEIWIDGKLYYQTEKMMSEVLAIRALNRKINSYNEMTGEKICAYPEIKGHLPIVSVKPVEPAKKAKPKTKARKPFTPYGLNGYLVDKNGNIHLMLDRKASSKTITINPDFFANLAEMVNKTLENKK